MAITKMSANLKLLSIEDLKILLHIQCNKVAREAKAKRLAEDAVWEAEQAAAEAAKKAEEEAAVKAAKVKARKAAKVGSRSEPEPGPSQKKGKGKARAMSVGSAEEAKEVSPFNSSSDWLTY
jgi:hypothetical protein